MKRIAIVCPRYGVELTEGHPRYTRQIAEKLVQRYEVDVLTTKAIDDSTWRNWYVRETENVRGVTVRRFNIVREKAANFNAYSAAYLQECRRENQSMGVERIWAEKHGPYSPDCIRYIMHHKHEYDIIIFVGYMHYLTVAGMPEAEDKAILIPLIEKDCPYFQFITFQSMFTMPKGFIFLTDEERMLVRKQFRTQGIPCEVMGTGAEVPDGLDEADFFRRHHITNRYLVYSGTIDEERGCPQLFHYFCEYKRRHPENPLKLVLMGRAFCELPDHEDVMMLGHVSDHEKYSGIAGADILVCPSQQENLPESVLSAMALGVPVLVNGACPTLKTHCIKSNAGLYYENYFEFEGAINMIFSREDVYRQLSHNALSYVRKNHEWDVVIDKFLQLINPAVQR